MFYSTSDLYFQERRRLSLGKPNILLRFFRNLDCHCFFAQTLHRQTHAPTTPEVTTQLLRARGKVSAWKCSRHPRATPFSLLAKPLLQRPVHSHHSPIPVRASALCCVCMDVQCHKQQLWTMTEEQAFPSEHKIRDMFRNYTYIDSVRFIQIQVDIYICKCVNVCVCLCI